MHRAWFRPPIIGQIYIAYQKTMAIRDYLAILLRSSITKCFKKTMAIDRKKTCIYDYRGRIATKVNLECLNSHILGF